MRPSPMDRFRSAADVATSAPASATAWRIPASWRWVSAYASPARKSRCARSPVAGSGRRTAKSATAARTSAVMPAAWAARTASATAARAQRRHRGMPGRQAGQETPPRVAVQINTGQIHLGPGISALKPVLHGVRTH